jgi:hypothetical protein
MLAEIARETLDPAEQTMRGHMHFIVGMSRSGITWLSRCLNLHPTIAVFGQSRFWGKYFLLPRDQIAYSAEECRKLHRTLRSFTWDCTVGDSPGCFKGLHLVGFRGLIDSVFDEVTAPITPSALFARLTLAISRQTGKPIVIEKTPHHVKHVDRIVAAYPQAKFIILYCGPYDYIRVQRAQPDLPFHPIGVALLWRRYHIACEDVMARYPNQAVCVTFSELLDEPKFAMSRVLNFLELPPQDLTAQMPSCRMTFSDSFDDAIDPAHIFFMNTLCGREVRASTSAMLTGRPSPLSIAAELARLPFWLASNLRMNAREVQGSLSAYYLDWLGLRSWKR